MEFTDLNGQIIMPVRVFKHSNLSCLSMGAYAWLCARCDLNVHDDQKMAEELDLELADWFAVKVELVNARLITSSPIEVPEDMEAHNKKMRELDDYLEETR